jgi:hypothetical protein
MFPARCNALFMKKSSAVEPLTLPTQEAFASQLKEQMQPEELKKEVGSEVRMAWQSR